jgi:hypothetical protein
MKKNKLSSKCCRSQGGEADNPWFRTLTVSQIALRPVDFLSSDQNFAMIPEHFLAGICIAAKITGHNYFTIC